MTGERYPDVEARPPAADLALERDLVDRARAGDRTAMGGLYDLHVDKIYRYVLVKVNGNHSDAEDITAEIFLKMIDALPRFQWQDVPFLAWLFRIAHNQVVSHYRRASARPAKTPIDDLDFIDPKHGPDWLVEQKLTLEDVYGAVRKLPEAQRRVIELRFGSGLSVRETAQILGKSENNVKVLQHKATTRLQKLLKT